jgi:endonuclease/exonuclease/phosphatase family metal-dependent hydrolase
MQNLKKWLPGILLMLAGSGIFAQGAEQIAVMTFNIRFDNPADGINAWSRRKDAVIDMLKKERVVVLGVQEALLNQLNDIKTGVPGLTWFGHGRDDGKTAGEFSAIYYDSTWFELLNGKTFWLSPTPDNPGVKGWDAACPRVVTWVQLKNRETGSTFFVINTHFDHMGEVARRNSALIVSRLAVELSSGGPVMLLGDFNASPESEVIQIIAEKSGLTEASARLKDYKPATDCTFTGFDGKACEHIDFIWISSGFQTEDYQILENDRGINRLSDHRPVKAILSL